MNIGANMVISSRNIFKAARYRYVVPIFQELFIPLLEIMELSVKSQTAGSKELGQRVAHVFNALCKTKKVKF